MQKSKPCSFIYCTWNPHSATSRSLHNQMYSHRFKGDRISEADTASSTSTASTPATTIIPSIRLPRCRASRRDTLHNRGRVVSGELCAYKALLEAGLPKVPQKPLPPLPRSVSAPPEEAASLLTEVIDSYAESTPSARYLAAAHIDPALLTGYS